MEGNRCSVWLCLMYEAVCYGQEELCLNQREELSECRPPRDPLGAYAYALCFIKVSG